MELEVVLIYEYSPKDANGGALYGLHIANANIQHHLMHGWDGAWISHCLPSSWPAVSSCWRWSHCWHIHPRETEVETLGAERKRVRVKERIITSWSGQRDGGSLSHLEKANNIFCRKPHGQEQYVEKAKHVRCVQKKA